MFKEFQRAPVALPGMNYKGHFFAGLVWPVESKRTGEAYSVTLTEKGWKCTCVGFNRHGKCKHASEIHGRMISDLLSL